MVGELIVTDPVYKNQVSKILKYIEGTRKTVVA